MFHGWGIPSLLHSNECYDAVHSVRSFTKDQQISAVNWKLFILLNLFRYFEN